MTIIEIMAALKAEILTGNPHLSEQVFSGYASDLLSDVLANAQAGQIWFTVQTNSNVAALATLKKISVVVFTGSQRPESDTLTKATRENLVLLMTAFNTFEAIKILTKAGL